MAVICTRDSRCSPSHPTRPHSYYDLIVLVSINSSSIVLLSPCAHKGFFDFVQKVIPFVLLWVLEIENFTLFSRTRHHFCAIRTNSRYWRRFSTTPNKWPHRIQRRTERANTIAICLPRVYLWGRYLLCLQFALFGVLHMFHSALALPIHAFSLVSPRQTSIYVMCPWDHDIWILTCLPPICGRRTNEGWQTLP